METSFIRLTLMTEKYQLATLVDQTRLSQETILNRNPLQDSDRGEYDPPKRPDSHSGLPHANHKALEMIHSESMIS